MAAGIRAGSGDCLHLIGEYLPGVSGEGQLKGDVQRGRHRVLAGDGRVERKGVRIEQILIHDLGIALVEEIIC